MSDLPDKSDQVAQVHAGLIRRVVMACQNRDAVPDLEALLQASEANGWQALVAAIRRILAGERDAGRFRDLDAEDTLIVQHILQGIQNPESLPVSDSISNPGMAGAGLAALIDAASSGDVQALRIAGEMAEQMSASGGQMARLGSILRPLINGERDADKLCAGMDTKGETLVLSILSELGKLQIH